MASWKTLTLLCIGLFLIMAVILVVSIKKQNLVDTVTVGAMVRYDDTGWGWAEMRFKNGKSTVVNSVDLVDSDAVWRRLKDGDEVSLSHYALGCNLFGKTWIWKHYDKIEYKNSAP